MLQVTDAPLYWTCQIGQVFDGGANGVFDPARRRRAAHAKISYFRRRPKTAEKHSQLTDSTPSISHHGLSSLLCPHASTKRAFVTFIFYYETLFCHGRAALAASCNSTTGGRLQKRALSSLMVLLALLVVAYHHCSAPNASTYKTNICYLYLLYYATFIRTQD